jgi:hypothetical protein
MGCAHGCAARQISETTAISQPGNWLGKARRCRLANGKCKISATRHACATLDGFACTAAAIFANAFPAQTARPWALCIEA